MARRYAARWLALAIWVAGAGCNLFAPGDLPPLTPVLSQ